MPRGGKATAGARAVHGCSTATITATVRDELTDKPIGGVVMSLQKRDGTTVCADRTTDDSGSVTFETTDVAQLGTVLFQVRARVGPVATKRYGVARVGHKSGEDLLFPGKSDTVPGEVPKNTTVRFLAREGARIAVIGAGAAGLAATYELCKAGYRVTLIEARDRFGGRAYTRTSGAVPFDLGCHWLHTCDPQKEHPWITVYKLLTKNLAIKYALNGDADRHYAVHVGNTAYLDAGGMLLEIYGELEEALDGDQAQAASTVLPAYQHHVHGAPPAFLAAHNAPTLAGLTNMAAAMLGALDEGTEMDNFSMMDKCRAGYEGAYQGLGEPPRCGQNEVPAKGFGALINDFATWLVGEYADLVTVELECAVELIVYGEAVDEGEIVRIETTTGDFKATAAVVTVPTSIITNGDIEFRPGLPDDVSDAFGHLPMGNFKKVFLKFNADVFGGAASMNVYPYDATGQQTWRFATHEPASNCVTAFTGGEYASGLDDQSDAEVIEAALSRLQAMFGAAVRAQYADGSGMVTNWGKDEYSKGAYSYCVPGHEGARAVIAGAALEDQIFFAGEAAFEKAYATAHGAYLSGVAVAEKIVDKVPLE